MDASAEADLPTLMAPYRIPFQVMSGKPFSFIRDTTLSLCSCVRLSVLRTLKMDVQRHASALSSHLVGILKSR